MSGFVFIHSNLSFHITILWWKQNNRLISYIYYYSRKIRENDFVVF